MTLSIGRGKQPASPASPASPAQSQSGDDATTLPTLTDAKNYLRIDADDDATIATLLPAASAELARYIGAELPDL